MNSLEHLIDFYLPTLKLGLFALGSFRQARLQITVNIRISHFIDQSSFILQLFLLSFGAAKGISLNFWKFLYFFLVDKVDVVADSLELGVDTDTVHETTPAWAFISVFIVLISRER